MANEAAIQNSNADQHTSSSNDETEANNDDNDTSKEGSGLWDFFDQCVAECTTVCTAGTEMSQYLKTKNLERKDDHIKCWKYQEAVYPNLQRSAKKYLCIIGTSVLVE